MQSQKNVKNCVDLGEKKEVDLELIERYIKEFYRKLDEY